MTIQIDSLTTIIKIMTIFIEKKTNAHVGLINKIIMLKIHK